MVDPLHPLSGEPDLAMLFQFPDPADGEQHLAILDTNVGFL